VVDGEKPGVDSRDVSVCGGCLSVCVSVCVLGTPEGRGPCKTAESTKMPLGSVNSCEPRNHASDGCTH